MGCGCGKNKMAKPATGITPTVNVQTSKSVAARVVAPASPYKTQMPPHLQTARKTV